MRSSVGRLHLMKQQLMTSGKEIEFHLDMVAELRNLILSGFATGSEISKPFLPGGAGKGETTGDIKTQLDNLRHALADVHDITGTLNALQQGVVLDDIGLFEIKKFALVTDHLKEILDALNTKIVEFADLSPVILILDPDKQRVPHFYVYDAYSAELAGLRKEYNTIVKQDLQKAEELRLKSLEIEDDIREKLTSKLLQYKVMLQENLAAVADLDLWLAKAELAVSLKLCRPEVCAQTTVRHKSISGNDETKTKSAVHQDESLTGFNSGTYYKGLFNPEVAEALRLKNKQYQPVDISITDGPALITGANMGGKTVLLKTVALAQYMCQYGFFVPAESAVILPVERIMTSMEDEQSELKGLSSYASEMLKINAIIHASRTGNHILALIDEPARTTNPVEGQALVNALVDILREHKVMSLVTTHYGGIQSDCRRLRVAGLKTDELAAKPTIETINDYMDYSLIELHADHLSEGEVPHEAIRIAEILEIDNELLERARGFLKKAKG